MSDAQNSSVNLILYAFPTRKWKENVSSEANMIEGNLVF